MLRPPHTPAPAASNTSLDFACVLAAACRIGESPVYEVRLNRLYFVDILSRQLAALDLSSGHVRWWGFESEVACVGLTEGSRVIIALRDRVGFFDPDTERFTELAVIEADRPETRLNDGKVGPDGALWIGTMDERPAKQPVAALYRVSADGVVERRVEGITTSNGLAWTADGRTMFHSDSRGPWVDRWAFDPESGAMTDRTRIATLDEETGRPDGGACDMEGRYWSAGVSAGRLNVFTAEGALVESHPLPVPAPTMPCFGGGDGRTLYVTSLTEGRPAGEVSRFPCAGGIIAARVPVAGVPPFRFRGV